MHPALPTQNETNFVDQYGCREAELLDAALEIEQLLFWVDSWVAGAGFSSFGGRETSSF